MNHNTTTWGLAIIHYAVSRPNIEFTNAEVVEHLAAIGAVRNDNEPVTDGDVSGFLSRRTLNAERGVQDAYPIPGLQATGKRGTWVYKPGEESISAQTRAAAKKPRKDKGDPKEDKPCVGCNDILEVVGVTAEGKVVMRHEDGSLGIYSRIE